MIWKIVNAVYLCIVLCADELFRRYPWAISTSWWKSKTMPAFNDSAFNFQNQFFQYTPSLEVGIILENVIHIDHVISPVKTNKNIPGHFRGQNQHFPENMTWIVQKANFPTFKPEGKSK